MRRFSQFYPTSARRRKGSRRRHGGRRGRRCFGRHRGAVALSPCVFFWRSGLRLWGKGVVTHPPQDDKMTRCGRRGNFQFYTKKKKRQLPFPDVTLQDGKSTVVVDAETETKKRVTGPDDQLQKPTKKAKERESKNSNSAATGWWPPRPRGQASWRGVPSWPW